MSQTVLVAVLQMLLGLFQAASYALLVWWAFGVLGDFPLEKYFRKVRFYHRLIPALALASLAFTPVKFLLDLLFSFPLDFSTAWIPPLLKFLEGLGFLGLLVYLCFSSPRVERVEVVEREKKVRRMKKVWIWVAAVAVILAALGGTYYYLSSQGYIVKFSLSKPKYLDYQNLSPRFSFSYSSKFVLDKDEESRFGEDYLIGIKLPSDSRVGCDVRAVKGKVNLDGELPVVTDSIAQQISKGAEDFEVLGSEFIRLGEEKAIKISISVKGPLGETMQMDQVFSSHNDNIFTLICGTTKDTYGFFSEDFSYFLDSFSWK